MNRTNCKVSRRSQAAEHRRSPRQLARWFRGPKIRQVLECARCCGALDFPRGSWSQGTARMPSRLSMNRTNSKSTRGSKAALKTHALQTLTRGPLTRPQARSVWRASDSSALSVRGTLAGLSGSCERTEKRRYSSRAGKGNKPDFVCCSRMMHSIRATICGFAADTSRCSASSSLRL